MSFRSQVRTTPPQNGDRRRPVPFRLPETGREVADHLMSLVWKGLTLRGQGMCLGGGAWRLHLEGPKRSRVWLLFRRAHAIAHSKRHHDLGCYAFGLPLSEVEDALQRIDKVGVSPLLLEAMRDAAEEVIAPGDVWKEHYAAETVEIHVRRRITPMQ